MKAKKLLAAILAVAMILGTMSLPAFAAEGEAWTGGEGTTVRVGDTYYTTLVDALKGVYKSSPSEVVTIECKPGADVGTMTHGHVADSIKIIGNGAYVSGGEHDIEVDTYKYSRETGEQDNTSGVSLDKNITITVDGLNGIAAWGERKTNHTVNLVFKNCKNMNRVYFSGVTGPNNITLNDCSFDADQGSHSNTSVYSNAEGTIELTNVTFNKVALGVNLNNKSGKTQTVKINNCTFTDCATPSIANKANATAYAAPIRVVSGAVDSSTNLSVENSAITYTYSSYKCANGDILLGDGREGQASYETVTADISNTAARVQLHYSDGRGNLTKNVAAGESVSVNNTWDESNAVAQVGDVKYRSLETALEKADGAEITLINDVMLSKNITIATDTTIDLNGHTITRVPVDPSESYYGAMLNLGKYNTKTTITIKDTAEVKGKIVGCDINNTGKNSTLDTISIQNTDVDLIIDGAVIEGAKAINHREGGVAISARNQKGGSITIKNGAVVKGGDSVSVETDEELLYKYSGTGGNGMIVTGTVNIVDSEVRGGNGNKNGYASSTGGKAIWYIPTDSKDEEYNQLNIKNATVAGGYSDTYNAGDAISLSYYDGSVINIEGSTIKGGDVLNEDGGIGGEAISLGNPATLNIVDSTIKGGNGGSSWIGIGIELAGLAKDTVITADNSTIAGGDRGNGMGNPITLSGGSDAKDTIEILLNDVTLEASENSYYQSVIYGGSAEKPLNVKASGTLTIANGELSKTVVSKIDNAPLTVVGKVDESTTAIEGQSKVFVKFIPSADDSTLYNVVLSGGLVDINRLSSAQLTFALESETVAYEINPAEHVVMTEDNGKYLFNFDGVNETDKTGKEIIIATVKFNGYGDVKFSVNEAADNAVHAATIKDNIVVSHVVGGEVSDTTGKLIINEAAGENGTIDTANTVPTEQLIINVTFPNAVVDNAAAYQDMKVVISGGDLAAAKEYQLGTDGMAMTDGGVYTITTDLTKDRAYTVTVSGAGYRTARYTVTMTEDKTLNFWNNVKDNAVTIEEGKTTGAVTKNFLAGDIVKDNNINIYDLSAVVSYFGTEGLSATNHSEYAKYDLNRDGKIDSKDVAYVLVSWNQ